jgi:predicted transport protein
LWFELVVANSTLLQKPSQLSLFLAKVLKHGKNFCAVNVQVNVLKLWLNIAISELDDPFKLARDVSNIGHHGTGQVHVRLSAIADLDKVMALVEQSFKQTI